MRGNKKAKVFGLNDKKKKKKDEALTEMCALF